MEGGATATEGQESLLPSLRRPFRLIAFMTAWLVLACQSIVSHAHPTARLLPRQRGVPLPGARIRRPALPPRRRAGRRLAAHRQRCVGLRPLAAAVARLPRSPPPRERDADRAWNWEAAEAFARLAATLGFRPAALAVAWASSHPAVSSTLLGARTVAQIEEALAASDLVLDPGLRARISSLTPAPPIAMDRTEEADVARGDRTVPKLKATKQLHLSPGEPIMQPGDCS